MPSRGQGLIYIGWSVYREPLDQTDLKNDVDATKEAVENRHNKAEADRWAQGPGGLQVRPASPTWHPLGSRFGVVSSRVLWNLLMPVSRWISTINSDMYVSG